jgi:hypothetical protein
LQFGCQVRDPVSDFVTMVISVCFDFDKIDAMFRFCNGICQVFYEWEFMVESHGVRFVPVPTDHV